MYWFPDTTVMRNFAVVRKTAIVLQVLGGGGRCAEAIHNELRDASSIRGYEELKLIIAQQELGAPIRIEGPRSIQEVQNIRRDEVGGELHDPLDSLGEAETLFLLRSRPEYWGSKWITDDGAAYDFGTRSGVETLCTRDVLAVATVRGYVSSQDALMYMGLMGSKGRVLAFAPTSLADFAMTVEKWRGKLAHDEAVKGE